MNRNILVFDMDGVITDPQLKEITQPEILEIISDHLRSGQKVAFNTGRSAEWLENKVIKTLKKIIINTEKNYFPLTNLISICEMGNVIIKYGTDGESRKKILNDNIIPKTLNQTVKDIVADVYSKSMFVDETKEVILTIEMNDGYSYEEYKKRQDEFQKEISIIMKNYHPHLHVKPSSTTIAIDIKPVDSGKNLGAKRIFEWLADHDEPLKGLNFICFGDSLSDLDMSDFFHSKDINTSFVYVGSEENIERLYPVNIPECKYTEGTLHFLKNTDFNIG